MIAVSSWRRNDRSFVNSYSLCLVPHITLTHALTTLSASRVYGQEPDAFGRGRDLGLEQGRARCAPERSPCPRCKSRCIFAINLLFPYAAFLRLSN